MRTYLLARLPLVGRRAEAYPLTRQNLLLASPCRFVELIPIGRGQLVDVSAVLMTFVSVTGIVLILFLQKRRYSGVIAALAGILLLVVVYTIWAPLI